MAYRYVSHVMDGVRRLMRILPDNVRKAECRRKESTTGPVGRPRWEFPAAWLMGRHTGYWKSVAIPQMEGVSPNPLGRHRYPTRLKP